MESTQLTAKRALVVDDSRSARISLQKLLEKHRIAVDFAESGEEALDYLKHHLVDAIFMDHTMPGMDGLETVVAIKSNPRTATIPVMMYTAKEGEVYVSQARALGAIGVLPKQVQPGVLFEMLRKLGLVPADATDETVAAATPREPPATTVVEQAAVAEGPSDAERGASGVQDSRAEENRAREARAEEFRAQEARVRETRAQDVRLHDRYAAADTDPEYDQRALGASVQALITRVLNEQHVQLRSDILTSHREFARQVASEVLAKERATPPPAPPPAAESVLAQVPSRGMLAVGALVLAVLLVGAIARLWQERQHVDALAKDVARLTAVVQDRDAALAAERSGARDRGAGEQADVNVPAIDERSAYMEPVERDVAPAADESAADESAEDEEAAARAAEAERAAQAARDAQATRDARAALEVENARAAQAARDRRAEYENTLRTIEWSINQGSQVAFEEPAFGDRRAAELEALLNRLVAMGFTGRVRLTSHLGQFCLTTDTAGEYRLAAPELPVDECSRLGHPLDESSAPEDRESTAFASFIATSPLVTRSGIDVELVAYDRNESEPLEAFSGSITTAGEWNEAARRNNRVRYEITPATPDSAAAETASRLRSVPRVRS
jgi:CheY-like chemotaxis protein